MLRHTPGSKNHVHIIRLASLLGFGAGFVDVQGFLKYQVLTNTISGHITFLAEDVSFENWKLVKIIALFMILFLLGALFSSLILSFEKYIHPYTFSIPLVLEFFILMGTAYLGRYYDLNSFNREIYAGMLLFAMSLQNALIMIVTSSWAKEKNAMDNFSESGIPFLQNPDLSQNHDLPVFIRFKFGIYLAFFFIVGAVLALIFFQSWVYLSFLIPALIIVFTLIFDLSHLKSRKLIGNI